MTALDLPVVDLADWRSADPDARARFLSVLGDALETWGFVAVTGHGVPVALLDEAYATAARFFAQPDAVKARLEHPEIGRQRGYTGFGVEHAKDSDKADIKEFWQTGRELPDDHPARLAGQPANVWPETPSRFRAVFSDLYARIDAFANELLEAITLHVGMDGSPLLDAVRVGNSVQRIIHYPPLSAGVPEGSVRSAAHEDINLLTVLPASTQPGLEVLDKATRTWRAVVTPPDVMVCDTGDILQRITGGRLPAITHRVVNPPQSANVARYSMPFFCHPRPDYLLPPSQAGGEPITAGAFLRERLIANGVLPADAP